MGASASASGVVKTMRVSRIQAAENRERILDVATRLFRERGIDGIGVDDLMKAAGLTHGGFYGHFKSKEDLVAQACARAVARMRQNWTNVVDQSTGDPLHALAATYLTPKHRDSAGRGCPMAALGSEIARQGHTVRRAFTDELRPFFDYFPQSFKEPQAIGAGKKRSQPTPASSALSSSRAQ